MRRTVFMLHAFGELEQKPAPSRDIELWSVSVAEPVVV